VIDLVPKAKKTKRPLEPETAEERTARAANVKRKRETEDNDREAKRRAVLDALSTLGATDEIMRVFPDWFHNGLTELLIGPLFATKPDRLSRLSPGQDGIQGGLRMRSISHKTDESGLIDVEIRGNEKQRRAHFCHCFFEALKGNDLNDLIERYVNVILPDSQPMNAALKDNLKNDRERPHNEGENGKRKFHRNELCDLITELLHYYVVRANFLENDVTSTGGSHSPIQLLTKALPAGYAGEFYRSFIAPLDPESRQTILNYFGWDAIKVNEDEQKKILDLEDEIGEALGFVYEMTNNLVELDHYQFCALRWMVVRELLPGERHVKNTPLADLKGGILTFKPGLGKTFTAIFASIVADLLFARRALRLVAPMQFTMLPTLVIAPPRILAQWADEIKTVTRDARQGGLLNEAFPFAHFVGIGHNDLANAEWKKEFNPFFDARKAQNAPTAKDRTEFQNIVGKFQFIVTSAETLFAEIKADEPVARETAEQKALREATKKVTLVRGNFLQGANYARIIVDESHLGFTNEENTRYKLLTRMKRRPEHDQRALWLMTGTPMSTSPLQILRQLELVGLPVVEAARALAIEDMRGEWEQAVGLVGSYVMSQVFFVDYGHTTALPPKVVREGPFWFDLSPLEMDFYNALMSFEAPKNSNGPAEKSKADDQGNDGSGLITALIVIKGELVKKEVEFSTRSLNYIRQSIVAISAINPKVIKAVIKAHGTTTALTTTRAVAIPSDPKAALLAKFRAKKAAPVVPAPVLVEAPAVTPFQQILDELEQKSSDGIIGKGSARLRKFREVLDRIPKEEKALVFGYFRRGLTLAREIIEEVRGKGSSILLLGGGGGKNAVEEIKRFRESPTIKFLVVNYQVAGAGLNITEANHIVLFEQGFVYSDIAQAIARSARRKQEQTVHVYEILANPVVDVEKRMKNVRDKRRKAWDLLIEQRVDMYDLRNEFEKQSVRDFSIAQVKEIEQTGGNEVVVLDDDEADPDEMILEAQLQTAPPAQEKEEESAMDLEAIPKPGTSVMDLFGPEEEKELLQISDDDL
jgi:hypothetical protein